MLVFYSTFTEWLHHRAYSKENFGLHSGDIYGEHGARAYNGGLGTEPQWGPGAEPLVSGSGGEAPLKLTAF